MQCKVAMHVTALAEFLSLSIPDRDCNAVAELHLAAADEPSKPVIAMLLKLNLYVAATAEHMSLAKPSMSHVTWQPTT